MMKKKIFIGLENIASQINDLKKGFESIGYNTLTAACNTTSTIVNNKTGIDLFYSDYSSPRFWFKGVRPRWLQKKLQDITKKNQRSEIMKRAVEECDIFFFVWTTFKDNHSDLAYLKKLGKKVIVLFVGDDIYFHPAGKQDFASHGLHPVVPYKMHSKELETNRLTVLNNRLQYIREAEKHADLIFTEPALAQLMLRPYYRFRHIVPLEQITFNPRQRKENPLIVFIPSDDEYKGSIFVERAMQQLQEEGVKFDLKIIRNLPYKEALDTYSEADILIGELFYPGGGKQQREALAAGTVVVTNFDPRYPVGLPSETPFIHANHENIYQVLVDTISNFEKRSELVERGRKFVETYNSEKVVCERMIDLLEGRSKEEIIKPVFLRNNYLPENSQESDLLSFWNGKVAGCEWYKNTVSPGIRARIKF